MSLNQSNSFSSDRIVVDSRGYKLTFLSDLQKNMDNKIIRDCKNGYIVCEYKEFDGKHIPGVLIVEKDPNSNIFSNDEDARCQAGKDGYLFLCDFMSIGDGVIPDIEENRQLLQAYFNENPVYCIRDMYLFSEVFGEAENKFYNKIGDKDHSEMKLVNYLDVNYGSFSSFTRFRHPYASSEMVNKILDKLDIDKEKFLSCLEIVDDDFINDNR